MESKRIKLIFEVVDLDPYEVIFEKSQIVMEFKDEEFEKLRDQIKEKLPTLTQEEYESILRASSISWVREIIEAATVAMVAAARHRLYEHMRERYGWSPILTVDPSVEKGVD